LAITGLAKCYLYLLVSSAKLLDL